MRPHQIAILPLIAVGLLGASDLDMTVTPRVSVGGMAGLGMTRSACRERAETIAAGTGAPVATTYDIAIAVNAEAPIILGLRWQDGPFSLRCGPAFATSWNRNDLAITSGSFRQEGRETVTAMAGKWYLGFGIHGPERLHLEVLPYLGIAAVRQRLDLTTVDGGTTTITATDRRGRMILYGITIGLHGTVPDLPHCEAGIRIGIVEGSGDVDDTDFRQEGGFAALECGWRL